LKHKHLCQPILKCRSNKYKSKALGISTSLVNEAYTTQTCPCCGELKKPSGRIYICKKCGFGGHRDVVGASNILSRRLLGELSRVKASSTMYRHPYLIEKRSHADTSARHSCKALVQDTRARHSCKLLM
jgi:transposase